METIGGSLKICQATGRVVDHFGVGSIYPGGIRIDQLARWLGSVPLAKIKAYQAALNF
jgi:hypothetical protein